MRKWGIGLAKLHELSDEQVKRQYDKYRKILDKIFDELEKRGIHLDVTAAKGAIQEMPMPSDDSNDSTQPFHLKLEETDLRRVDFEKKKQRKKVEDEGVKVTQLLKLSEDEIRELNEAKTSTRQIQKKEKSKKG